MTKKYVYFVSFWYEWPKAKEFGRTEAVLNKKIDSSEDISKLESMIAYDLFPADMKMPVNVKITNFILLREECSMCANKGCPDCTGIQSDIPPESEEPA